jgi:hypothetical protein
MQLAALGECSFLQNLVRLSSNHVHSRAERFVSCTRPWTLLRTFQILCDCSNVFNDQSRLTTRCVDGDCQTLVPRGGYITLLSSKLRAYFGPSANALGEELWFEHDRTGAPTGVV